MSNMYSDMGRFLQESFTIDNTFKKSTKRSLKESVKKSSKRLLKEDFDNQVTLPEVLGWLSEHDTAYEDCKRYFEVDFDDPNFDAKAEGITVDDLEDWISEHDSLWSDYVDYFELSEYLNESLKEDLNLNEYGELQGSDTIAYDKGWEHYEGDDMPEDGVWLTKSFESDEGDFDGEIQADSEGIYAALYRSNGSQVFSKSDFDSIGQAVLTIERVVNDRYNHYYESLKEDFADARPATTKIRNFIEMGADPAAILDELLRFLPDSALTDFADYYGENFLGTGDDWE